MDADHVIVQRWRMAERRCLVASSLIPGGRTLPKLAVRQVGIRHGYRIKDLMEQLYAQSADIKALFNNTLNPVRATELREKMLRAGLPI